ncbi:MAG TPA: chloride channel protein [Puia sp.]|jgi:H+/Cl- antiporter ClcA
MKLFKHTREFGKAVFDRIGNEKVKQNILQALPFWIAALFTGIIAVIYSKLFAWTELGTIYVFRHYEWIFILLTPACFVLGWWIVKKFAPYSRGSGIPQIMAALELNGPEKLEKTKKLLSIRIIIVKICSSLVMVFGGGVIGREGPTIQIAGSVFRKINQILPDWWPKISRKNMIMTGAAAGLAAAFNTPLGGIVFAVEELTKTHINQFKSALFAAIIIAGLTAQEFLGPYLYLGYPDVSNLSGYIFFAVVLVAIVTGLVGSSISKLMVYIFKWKMNFKNNFPHLLYLVCCGLIIALLAVFVSESIFGSGKELITRTLFTSDKYTSWQIVLFRIFGPVLSFTSGAAGGIFAPALSAGAGIGSMLAGWFELTATNTNIMILAGMVGFLTGVTRTPFTSAILVLEMTDRHNVIFHLMLAGLVANMVSLLIDKHSFYDRLKNQYLKDLHKEAPALAISDSVLVRF